MNWILNGTGKWHAWPRGGRQTVCGRINVEHLRVTPAKQILHEKPDGELCDTCARKLRLVAHEVCGSDSAAAWAGVLRRHLTKVRVRLADVLVVALATRLAEVGPPQDATARAVFAQVRDFLLRPEWIRRSYGSGTSRSFARLPNLKTVLAALPPEPKALQRLAGALDTWHRITGRIITLERCNAARVIETIFQIPSVEPYVQHLHARGHPHLALMFHPNTLTRAKKEPALRGMFAGSTAYWDSNHSQLTVVTD